MFYPLLTMAELFPGRLQAVPLDPNLPEPTKRDLVGFACVPCMEGKCAFWIKGEESPGGCCIPRVAHYLAGGLGEAKALPRELALVTAAIDDAAGVIENALEPWGRR